jgi:hypothetical protein
VRMLAAEATRVYTKDELLRTIWGFRQAGTSRCNVGLDAGPKDGKTQRPCGRACAPRSRPRHEVDRGRTATGRRPARTRTGETASRLVLRRREGHRGGMTTLQLTLQPSDLNHLRLLLRDALSAEHELLGEIRQGLASDSSEDDALDRIGAVERLAAGVGGLY